MKKITTILVSFAVLFTVSFASAQTTDVGIALGISLPDAPDTVAFDSAVSLDFGINKYFALGIESGFGWVKNDLESGDSSGIGLPVTSNVSENFYSIPLLAMATLNIPLGEYEMPVVPFISGGAGYSWTIYDGITNSYTFSGFTWQAVGGVKINLGSDAGGMQILIEAGWRGTEVSKEILGQDLELEMSGLVARAGLSFPILGGDNW